MLSSPVGVVSLAGRLIAQAIVVGLWLGGMSQQGVDGGGPARFFGSLVFAAVPTVPPALLIGALDGAGRAFAGRWRAAAGLRVAATLVLVGYSATWIYFIGLLATMTGLNDPALPTYLGALAGMELALVAEWLSSWLIGRRRRRRAWLR